MLYAALMTSLTTSGPRPFRRGFANIPENWSALDHVPWGQPVVVEVGCGTGDWICAQAAQNPGIHYIGIERTEVRSGKLLHHATTADLSNLTAIRADAVLLLDQKCPPESVDAFYFFYPNPYPKPRQANKRFFVGSSFYIFDRCLKPGGTIYIASNIPQYITEARQQLEAAGYTLLRHGPIAMDIDPRTAFERKYRARDEMTVELEVKKPTI